MKTKRQRPKLSLDQKALYRLRQAAWAINQLRVSVDPGHILMSHYLERLEIQILSLSHDLEDRCKIESGEKRR